MAPRALAGIPRWAPRTRPRPTHARPPGLDTLSVFMGFIATLVHSTSHSRLAGRHYRSHRAPRRSLTYSGGHGPCRHPHSHSYSHSLAAAKSSPSSQRRFFHNYFVTHLPSSSLHPDPGLGSGPHHKLPRSASTPHTPDPGSRSLPAASPPVPRNLPSRDLTVVRIPLRSAKHHFGAHNSRGTRAYNEDENQAGTIDLPAFARRAPVSLSRSRRSLSSGSGSGDGSGSGEGSVADSPSGDPQIFYFGVFDGHGGNECSAFLRDELQGYIEETAVQFGLGSSLRRGPHKTGGYSVGGPSPSQQQQQQQQQQPETKSADEVKATVKDDPAEGKKINSDDPEPVAADVPAALRLERELLAEYKDTVGGYFRRFKPPHFSVTRATSVESATDPSSIEAGVPPVTIESVLTYAFLRADLDFVTAQARKPDPDDPHVADFPVNRDEVLGAPHARHHHHLAGGGDTIGGPTRFKGGSTATVALVSTPTPQPFWHPSAHSTLLVAHVGDSRALLCETATGLARPLTNDHHPSSPLEARRLRRFFAAGGSLATDSFGEERLGGLANSRAFGDLTSKRLGVSAEPELCRTDLGPAEYSFLVLASDGVSGTLSDQEMVDIIKEARTPEQGARDVVEYATEVSADGDNATCLVVRLGGWERRSEGGVGSLGTKEIRDVRRAEAQDPRRGRR